MKTGRPITLPGQIGNLARAHSGGLQGLADDLGVHRATLGRWAREDSPIPHTAQIVLDGLARTTTPPESKP